MKFLQKALIEPQHLVQPNAWAGHIPFAGWIVSVLRPDVLVELGTHTGNSYLSFCQAVKQEQLDTKCYAIDTWQGDKHASFYGEEIFQSVCQAHDPHYSRFSKLLRTTFDEAATRFDDKSIDLLHIDGLHTYEAVKHDFETWLPKLSDKAVVLFHDTEVYRDDFGVHQFWYEIGKHYPYFSFQHSNGLGVLLVGNQYNQYLLELCENQDTLLEAKLLFQQLGSRLEQKLSAQNEKSNLQDNIHQQLSEISSLNKELSLLKKELSKTQKTLSESSNNIVYL